MSAHIKPAMEWRKFIVLGVDKGQPWKDELARIRKVLPRTGAPKLVFLAASEANNEEEEDLETEL
jgi:hypothetical protein